MLEVLLLRFPSDNQLCKNELFIIQFPYQFSGQMERHIFHQANTNPPIMLQTTNIEASIRLAS